MKSIRRFSFAVVLTLSALGQFAALAHAQSPVQGRFNLPYEVNWENTVVPAGDYEFYLRPAGGSELLTLEKVGGSSFGFLALARAPEPVSSGDLNKLVFVVKRRKAVCQFHAIAGVWDGPGFHRTREARTFWQTDSAG